MPVHPVTSNPANPDSSRVGTVGILKKRFAATAQNLRKLAKLIQIPNPA
jgi:hypothetical protein